MDSSEAIREKIARAVTDSEKTIAYAPDARPGISNLVTIYAEFIEATPQEVVKKYAGKGYAEFKKDLAELLIQKLTPFRVGRSDLLQRSDLFRRKSANAFAEGSKAASKIADKTLAEAKQKIGLL